MNKVIIYHVSLDPIRSGCIERQLKIMRLFCENQGWELVNEYVDLSRNSDKQENLQTILNTPMDANILLIKNAYFLSRNTVSFIKIKKQLENKGIRIYSLADGEEWL